MEGEFVLLIVVLLAGFYMSWNIGANDVANAMGTSVGSGALTLKQAVMIAAVLEFCGAFFFGSHVSETIQTGIVAPDIFMESPRLLVYGMLAALLAAGAWLQFASYYGWPVSTTHSIVGAVIGFGVIVGGVEAIYWKNVTFIVSSWLISPLMGGILAYGVFSILRRYILYTKDPLGAAKRLSPFFAFIVAATLGNVFIVKGLRNLQLPLTPKQMTLIIISIGALGSLLCYLVVRRISGRYRANTATHLDYQAVERVFSYLQITSASLMAFAHGANDVANAIGPLSAAVTILRTGTITAQTAIPTWALGLGGAGIIIGLATWGWRVIETIGRKITELTPTRGFSAEFGAAATILIASRLGLPISTTHTLVGAVVGVGFARGIGAINLDTLREIVISWVVTVPAGAMLAVAFFYALKAIFG